MVRFFQLISLTPISQSPLLMIPMSKLNSVRQMSQVLHVPAGKPSMQITSKQPVAERKISDPSSCYPKGERYPIPNFFEYRIKARDYDPL